MCSSSFFGRSLRVVRCMIFLGCCLLFGVFFLVVCSLFIEFCYLSCVMCRLVFGACLFVCLFVC